MSLSADSIGGLLPWEGLHCVMEAASENGNLVFIPHISSGAL